jgi:hypothetical protein
VRWTGKVRLKQAGDTTTVKTGSVSVPCCQLKNYLINRLSGHLEQLEHQAENIGIVNHSFKIT